jgi:hypothetical protein
LVYPDWWLPHPPYFWTVCSSKEEIQDNSIT